MKHKYQDVSATHQFSRSSSILSEFLHFIPQLFLSLTLPLCALSIIEHYF